MFKKFLKKFRIFILNNQREIIISRVFTELIYDYRVTNNIKILDFGSGFQPLIIRFVIKNLEKLNISISAHCYDYYNDKQLKILNKNNKEKFFNVINMNSNLYTYDFTIISDVLHHIGVDKNDKIINILQNLKKKSNYIIIKDHFEDTFFARQILRFMDFIGNYYNNVSIPKKYFKKNDFEKILKNNNFKIVKKIVDTKVYSKKFLFFSNPKLHFVYLIK